MTDHRPPVDGRPEPTLQVAVVPHTHWDREWYEPFQAFRLRLVRLVDDLLALLERDPGYRTFLLDGQLALVDDYLEVRPENEERLRALTAAGRIAVGPWYILMDEFLVSGETIVRDLQMGIRRAAEFGGAMEVGYLPDMFGHVAQMPQLLSLAGMTHAVVWRGVPSAVDRTAFLWRAPDGSQVRAEYLVSGYGNGASLPDDAKALIRRVDSLAEETGSFLRPGDPLLVMNGTDHQGPQPWLGRVVSEANQVQAHYGLSVMSLPDYLAGVGSDGLPEWTGELRSGWRANLLMGVGSNRVDVKQAAAGAERSLERVAEPLSALFLPPAAWPARVLDLAWALVVRNAAHDSICACSADDVTRTVLDRYAEARQIGEALADQARRAIAVSMAAPGTTIVNPTASTRSGMVEVVVAVEGGAEAHTQALSEHTGMAGTFTVRAPAVASLLGVMQGDRIDDDTFVTEADLSEDESGIVLRVELGSHSRAADRVEEVKRELYSRLVSRSDAEVRITVDQPAVRRVLARQAAVPGFGWSSFAPARLEHPVRVLDDGESPVTLSNGLVTVVVDAGDGTFSVDGHAGFGRLVDGGDHGDTYNYSPPAHDREITTPESVRVAAGEPGPVRGTVAIHSRYRWPERIDDSRSARTGTRQVEVTTTVELQADEPLVRVHTRFDNPCRDHRVRVRLPLPRPSATSVAECAFTTVERGLTAEGRTDELGTPTFPSRRFVSAGGLTVVHDGLVEYELTGTEATPEGDLATELSLTLLRATGMLSRLGMATRPLPAGPLLPLEGPQMIGPVEARYGLCLDGTDPYRLAEAMLDPLQVVVGFGGGERPASGSALHVTGAEVSSVRREAGALEVRVFNPTDHPVVVELGGRRGWEVDLRGRPLLPFEGRLELRARGIATLRFD